MFEVDARSYDRFMGRYSGPLAPLFADFAGVAAGQRVLDVGCGPGALTALLAARGGAVAGVDPSEPFVAAARERVPSADVRLAPAEALPFPAAGFDAALAQLVVQFMDDPARGVREMARVTRPGGVVAACIWDHGTGRGALSRFWEAARAVDDAAPGEEHALGAREGQLRALLDAAGLDAVEDALLTVERRHASFEEWWQPFTLGVGPAGAYLAGLDPDGRERLRERCRSLLEADDLVVSASAWAARGRVP